MNTLHKNAFTLIELLLGMTILSLVIGSVFTALQVSIDAFERGQQNMEQYQSGRIALREVSEELRFALSADAFWRPQDNFKAEMSYEQFMETMAMANGNFVQEVDPGAIRFIGDKSSVLFVRKVYQLGMQPPFDLQECRIYVTENSNLVLEIMRSLLQVKQATWLFRTVFDVNLGGQVISDRGQPVRFREINNPDEIPLPVFIGNYGSINHQYLIAEGINSIDFRYTNGENWSSNWNSQEIITDYRVTPDSPNFNPQRDMLMREKGLPSIVQISLELENNEMLNTAVDVPAGYMRDTGLYNQPPRVQPPQQGPQNQNAQRETPGAAPVPAGTR